MAPVGESAYFPPLDRCFTGEHQLLSWKTTYAGLSGLNKASLNRSLRQHLTDAHTVALLTKPFAPFPPPTPQTKSSLETKTSAVNLLPVYGQYDVKQIREDALWLSKETSIDEISALRIVVLEWQTRPAAQLLRGFSDEETSTMQDVVGGTSLQASLLAPKSSFAAGSGTLQERSINRFNDADPRHLRLLEIYLSERRYILKVSEYLVYHALHADAPEDEARSENGTYGHSAEGSGWVAEVGSSILASWNLRESPKGKEVTKGSGKHFLIDAVSALQSRLDSLEKGSGWYRDEGIREEVEEAWSTNQILEMAHIMQIMIDLLGGTSPSIRSDTVLAWFRFVSRYGFMDQFELPFESQRGTYHLVLQSLVALVSVAVLNVPHALEELSQSSNLAPGASNFAAESSYLLNPGAIVEINDILLEAAKACLRPASPAVLAWSIILQTLRDHALVTKELRELRQSQRAADRYGTAETDTNGSEPSYASNALNPSPRRRSSTGSDTSQPSGLLEEVLDRLMDTSLDEDPIAYLAKSAVDGSGVFDVITSLSIDFCTPFGSDHQGGAGLKMRLILLDLLRATGDWLDYIPELVLATLAVLTGGERFFDTVERAEYTGVSEPATIFLNDDLLMQKFFQTALSRFPYEPLPFLQLCRALASHEGHEREAPSTIGEILSHLGSFTQKLPAGFDAYELVQEEEDANHIKLSSSLGLFQPPNDPRSKLAILEGQNRLALTSYDGPLDGFQMPRGTKGRVLSEKKPLVVMWQHDYSGLTYIGKLLQSALTGDELLGYAQGSLVSKDIVTTIIGLLTCLLMSICTSSNPLAANQEAARTILEGASDGLDRNQDIVSVVFEIFEQELQRPQQLSEDQGSTELLANCLQFMHAILFVMPGRVWAFLGRSGLLGTNDGESKLIAIVSSTEMVTGHYDFLLGCIRLFEALVEDAVAHSIARRSPPGTVTRFASTDFTGKGVSDNAIKKVLLSLERTMIDVFESTPNWRFGLQEERLEINTRICTAFRNVLSYCYDIDDTPDIAQKLTGNLAPSAECLLQTFLTSSSSDLPILPLLHVLLEAAATPNTTLSTRGLHYRTAQVVAAVELGTTLVQINKVLDQPPARLEEQLFKAAPLLAKAYISHESYKLPVIELFEALVRSATRSVTQPPSLLGHLGPGTARNFLEILSILDQPLGNDDLAIGIWRLLAAVVSNRQQWLAIFLLTGDTPRDSLKKNGKVGVAISRRAKPILFIAMDSLTEIQTLQPERALAMLEFVVLAANFWPWVMTDLQGHPDFLTAISEFVGLRMPHNDYNRIRMASFIADILAMNIHHSQQLRDDSPAKSLLPRLGYFIEHAITGPCYNTSLHSNLRKNLESKFPGCTLSGFKRTTIRRSRYGRSYYYDLSMAGKVLAFDIAWAGRKGRGFAEEIARANVDLSTLDSQVHLFHSWKTLAIELSASLASDAAFQKIMVSTARHCLQSNAESNLPEAIFEQISQSRAELAFTLLQRLVEFKPLDPEVKDILPTAWNTVRSHSTNLELALTGNNSECYRTHLKILFLALQAHALGSTSNLSTLPTPSSPETIQTVLETLRLIVAQGFRSLTTNLHDDPSRAFPADFSLLTAMLRTCLRIPGIDRHTSQILSDFADNNVARYASTLFSWSDQLTIDQDPVYGEISILFLLELSFIPTLAEHLAVEGILTRLSSANLMNYFRRPKGSGPFDAPTRMFAVWARGILPLCLNLLAAVGAPMASEVAAFLNQFSAQLTRASAAFDSKPIAVDATAGYITLSMISEAQSLALIAAILDTFRAAGAGAGVVSSDIAELNWNRAQVREDIENWLQRRNMLRERIVPSSEKEVAWGRMKAMDAGSECETRLEEKVVGELRAVATCLGSGAE